MFSLYYFMLFFYLHLYLLSYNLRTNLLIHLKNILCGVSLKVNVYIFLGLFHFFRIPIFRRKLPQELIKIIRLTTNGKTIGEACNISLVKPNLK